MDEKGAPTGMTLEATGSLGPGQQVEGLTRDFGQTYCSLEDPHRLCRLADHQLEPVCPELDRQMAALPRNEGVEALVMLEPHQLLVIPEGHRGDTEYGCWLLDPQNPPEGRLDRLTIQRTDGFDVSDAARLPNGDVLLLERNGNRHFRLQKLAGPSLLPGARLHAETLMEIDPQTYLVPPFEALAIHQGPQGDILLTMMSDNGDRYSKRHATRLFRFRYQP